MVLMTEANRQVLKLMSICAIGNRGKWAIVSSDKHCDIGEQSKWTSANSDEHL